MVLAEGYLVLRQILTDGSSQIFRRHVVIACGGRNNGCYFVFTLGNSKITHQLPHINRLFAALGALDDLDDRTPEQIAYRIGKAIRHIRFEKPQVMRY